MFKHDRWFVDKVDEDLLIPLCQTDNEYISSLDNEYVIKAVNGRIVNFAVVTEFSHPELFTGTAWGEGEIQAQLVNNRRNEIWDDIFMKHRNLSDGELLDYLYSNYEPPKTKMPF